jgi:alanine dehydrogenase
VHEYRVGATPAGVRAFVDAGHQVAVEEDAGIAIGLTDAMYREAGATVVATAAEVYQAEMIVKVKEPQPTEFPYLRKGQILFCYLHLAPDPEQTAALLEKKVIAIAYDTVTDAEGRLPLLVPMSEIAGRVAIQVGAVCLQLNNGGKGVLLGGVPGVTPAHVVVIGGGIVGTEAARMALGLGARVTLLDRDLNRLRALDALFGPHLQTLFSNSYEISKVLPTADLVIGAVLIPGKSAPKVVTHAMIKTMTPGSVVVDVAIDQGGCFETSRPTTHSDPTYVVDGVIHYCVTNMPGVCSQSSTKALTNATFPYALAIANLGVAGALRQIPGLVDGLNVYHGKVTNLQVAEDLGYPYVLAATCLSTHP